MKPTIYLFFPGTCEQAFRMYEDVFGAKIEFLMRVGDAPGEYEGDPAWKNAIMHGTLKFGGTTIMASDAPADRRETPQGFFVACGFETTEKAEEIFAALSEGGIIKMPMDQTFWAKRFGMCVDKFGTPWMISCDAPPED